MPSYSGWAGKMRPERRGVEEVHTAIISVCGGPKSRFSEILTCRPGVKHVETGGSVEVRGEGGGFRPELSESPAVTHDSRHKQAECAESPFTNLQTHHDSPVPPKPVATADPGATVVRGPRQSKGRRSVPPSLYTGGRHLRECPPSRLLALDKPIGSNVSLLNPLSKSGVRMPFP